MQSTFAIKEEKSQYLVHGCMWLLLCAITQNLRTDLSSWEADSALQALDRLSKIQMQLISLITTWNRICVQEEMEALRAVTGILQHTGAMCWHPACSNKQQTGNFLHSLQQKMFSLETNCMAAAG